jgi:hypothetical protein
VAGADRVILQCERRTEQRHDPVAHHSIDGTIASVNGLHHALEHRIQDAPRFLWVAIRKQFHRALRVSEEDGDLLALSRHRPSR